MRELFFFHYLIRQLHIMPLIMYHLRLKKFLGQLKKSVASSELEVYLDSNFWSHRCTVIKSTVLEPLYLGLSHSCVTLG